MDWWTGLIQHKEKHVNKFTLVGTVYSRVAKIMHEYFNVHQSVWNICTHTAYNVHKTHNKSLSSRDVNSSGGGESPCLSSWSMTLQMRVGILS